MVFASSQASLWTGILSGVGAYEDTSCSALSFLLGAPLLSSGSKRIGCLKLVRFRIGPSASSVVFCKFLVPPNTMLGLQVSRGSSLGVFDSPTGALEKALDDAPVKLSSLFDEEYHLMLQICHGCLHAASLSS